MAVTKKRKTSWNRKFSRNCWLKKAITLLSEEQKLANKEKYLAYREIILSKLREENIDFEVNGSEDNHLAHILNIWFKGVKSNLLLSKLDLLGYAISTGSACSAGTVAPSPVILAMKPETKEAASESIRISFGYGLTSEDIEMFSEKLAETIKSLV